MMTFFVTFACKCSFLVIIKITNYCFSIAIPMILGEVSVALSL